MEKQTVYTAKEVNNLAMLAIEYRFGEEHAHAVGSWYEGEDVPADRLKETIAGIVEHYSSIK